MFHEVRVLNARKNLKKIISAKELSRRHWNEFDKKQEGFSSPQKNKTKSSLQ